MMGFCNMFPAGGIFWLGPSSLRIRGFFNHVRGASIPVTGALGLRRYVVDFANVSSAARDTLPCDHTKVFNEEPESSEEYR